MLCSIIVFTLLHTLVVGPPLSTPLWKVSAVGDLRSVTKPENDPETLQITLQIIVFGLICNVLHIRPICNIGLICLASARLLLSSLCRLVFEAQNNFYPPTAPQQEALVTGSFNLQDILFYGGCGFSIMRCMSFALENCEKKEGNYTFSDLVKYNFYLPFFFFGPIMTFDRFHAQVRIEIKRNIKINCCFF